MKIAAKIPFALTSLLMLGLGGLAWSWTHGVPVKAFFGGHVFTATFSYVGDSGDSFQVGIHKMFLVAITLTAVILPVIALGGLASNFKTSVQQRIFLILSLALCVFPLSALCIVVVALSRYILDMGLTAARAQGVIYGILGISIIAVFLFLLAKFIRKTPRPSGL